MKKALLMLCFASLCLLVACGQGPAASQGDASASDASDSTDSAACDVSSEGLPDYDFGFDEAEYLRTTYGLKDAEHLDLVNFDQFVWLALNRIRAVVAITDVEEEASKSILSSAQKGVDAIGGADTVYVYEPQRDAEDRNWGKLTEELVHAGIANLKDVAPGRIVHLSKQSVDESGSPAPVKKEITNPDKVQDAVMDAYTLICCI